MAGRLFGAVVLAAILAGCSLVGGQTSTILSTVGQPGNGASLTIENRGGPTLSVRVNGAEVVQLHCDEIRSITPGVNGVPPLPWTITIARRAGDAIVLTRSTDVLPLWILQMGDSLPLLTGTAAPQGPPGPSCPPR